MYETKLSLSVDLETLSLIVDYLLLLTNIIINKHLFVEVSNKMLNFETTLPFIDYQRPCRDGRLPVCLRQRLPPLLWGPPL